MLAGLCIFSFVNSQVIEFTEVEARAFLSLLRLQRDPAFLPCSVGTGTVVMIKHDTRSIFALLMLCFTTVWTTWSTKQLYNDMFATTDHNAPPLVFQTTCNSSGNIGTTSRVDQLMSSNPFLTVTGAFAQLLENYTTWHAKVTEDPASATCAKVLIWTCGTEVGLGDRMRGPLHALFLAIETGRYLALEPPERFPLKAVLGPNKIRWDTELQRDDDSVPTLDAFSIIGHHRPDVARVYGRNGFASVHDDKPILKIKSRAWPLYERMMQTAWWRRTCPDATTRRCAYLSAENVAILRMASSALFRFSPLVATWAEQFAAGHRLHRYVSVHARLGGEIDSINDTRFKELNKDINATAAELLRCTQMAANRNGLLKAPIFLATDDSKFQHAFSQLAADQGHRVVLSPVAPKHTFVSSSARFTANGWDRAVQVLGETVIDVMLLGKAELLVSTGSGLANFALFSGSAELQLLSDCQQARPSIRFPISLA